MKKKAYISLVIFTLAFTLSMFSCTTTSNISSVKEKTAEPNQESSKNVHAIHNVLPDGDIELLDSFEEGNFWQAEGESYATDADLTEDWSSEGEVSGLWQFMSIPQEENAVFYCEGLIDTNWTGAKYFIFDVNNTLSKSITVQLAIEAGKTKETTYTEKVTLGSGLNTNVMFSLLNQTTDENGLQVPGITEADNIKKAMIVIYGKALSGELNIDNIRLIR